MSALASRTRIQRNIASRVISVSRLALCCGVVSLLSSPVMAQEENGVELKTVVITASGYETDKKDAPASISVITSEDIAKMPAQDVRDVLSRVEGVTLGRSGNLNTVQIRGLGERYTLFMIDGKRVTSTPNLFRSNDYDSGWVPLDAIERIEVVRGPMSSLYGSDAMGGVVNIITKKVADKWHGSITTDYTVQQHRDSGDSIRTGFFVSGPLMPYVGLKVYGSWDRRTADDDSINPNPNLPGFTSSTNKFIDATVTWAMDEQNSFDFNYGYSHRNHDDFPVDRHALSLTHNGDYDFGKTELRLWGDRVHNYRGQGNVAGTDEPNTAYNAGVDGKIILPIDMWKEQTLTIGGSYRYQSLKDPYILTGGDSTTSSVWQGALFVEDEIKLTDKFSLTLGNRFDHHENFGSHNSPRAYGVYHLTDELTIKGGWSSAFKAPTLLENSPNWRQISCGGGCYLLGSTELEPETSQSVELGVSYDAVNWGGGVTLFRNRLKNMIPFPPNRTGSVALAPTYDNFVGFTSDGIPMFTYENVDRAQTQGVEATLYVKPHADWNIKANYTYLDAKNLSGEERPLAYQPRHSANLGVDWSATDKLDLSFSVNYVGKQYTYVPANGNLANASKTDAFVTADIMASYAINENFSVRGGVINIADKRVLRTISDDFNVEGRRYFLSATAKF